MENVLVTLNTSIWVEPDHYTVCENYLPGQKQYQLFLLKPNLFFMLNSNIIARTLATAQYKNSKSIYL